MSPTELRPAGQLGRFSFAWFVVAVLLIVLSGLVVMMALRSPNFGDLVGWP